MYWKAWGREIQSSNNECTYCDLRLQPDYEKALQCDGIMWHIDMKPSMQMAAAAILTTLEFSAGKTVFPNFNTRWHFDNKVFQAYLLKQMGLRTPSTNVFWKEDEALEWAQNKSDYPVIGKLKRGASSSCVYLLKNKADAAKYVRKMFSAKGMNGRIGGVYISPYRRWRDLMRNTVLHLPRPILQLFLKKRPRLREEWGNERGYAYFQEYLPENTYDTRITVIGHRAFAFRRMNREGDFRASGSGNIDYDVNALDLDMITIAHEMSKQNNFQSMAYDFLYDKEKKPTLIEISYAYQSNAVYNCPGFWNRQLNWIEGHILPEAAHVEDFLAEIHETR